MTTNLENLKFHIPYLGLLIVSNGFGAWIMCSWNLGFSSASSFRSEVVLTSGLTGSGGFSLLWKPFVQPYWGKHMFLFIYKCSVVHMHYKLTKTATGLLDSFLQLHLLLQPTLKTGCKGNPTTKVENILIFNIS